MNNTIDLNNPPGHVTIKPPETLEDADLRRKKEWYTFILCWGVIIVMGVFLASLIYIRPTDQIAGQSLNALIGLFTGGISYLIGQRSK